MHACISERNLVYGVISVKSINIMAMIGMGHVSNEVQSILALVNELSNPCGIPPFTVLDFSKRIFGSQSGVAELSVGVRDRPTASARPAG